MPFWANTTAYEASKSKHELTGQLYDLTQVCRFLHDLWTDYEVAPVARRKIIKRHLPAIVYWAEHARTVSFMIIWKVRSLYHNILC